MATWKSDKHFEYRDDHTSYRDGHFDYYEWEYNTGADYLTIRNVLVNAFCAYTGKDVGGGEEKFFLGPDQTNALYRCLRHHIARYRGIQYLKRLDDEVIKDE